VAFLGVDAVFQCDAEGCKATARARIPQGEEWKGSSLQYLDVMRQLLEAGFEAEGGGWVCWNHGGGKKSAPEPAPTLQRTRG
jgi:hypothetical protein